MKKIILYVAALIFIAWAATSCEALNDCKFCKTVTTDKKTGDVTEGPEVEYCGAKLIAVQTAPPTHVGDLETVYECR